jgi:hypothetical protein
MAKGSLLESVGDAVVASRPASWWDSLPKDVQKELLEIRKTFQSGGYPIRKLTLARILADKCEERGLRALKERRFSEWLQKS